MKFLTMFLVMAAAASSQAKDLEIQCEITDAPYLQGKLVKTIPLNRYTLNFSSENVTISYSDSECEDSTHIDLAKESFKALKKGEMIYAMIKHQGPEIKIEGGVSCQLKK